MEVSAGEAGSEQVVEVSVAIGREASKLPRSRRWEEASGHSSGPVDVGSGSGLVFADVVDLVHLALVDEVPGLDVVAVACQPDHAQLAWAALQG